MSGAEEAAAVRHRNRSPTPGTKPDRSLPRRCPPFVAASPTGLVMRLRGSRIHAMPWREIAGLKIDELGDLRFVNVIPVASGPLIDLSSLVSNAEAVEALQSRQAMRTTA